MPRQARIDAPGALHHIIVRGIERKAIFRDDQDRFDYLSRVERLFTETSATCYAWALMTNHCHFLIGTGKASVATLMRRLLTGYAVTFNRRHRRHGQLFQNRYKSILCQEDPYLLELTRYIHLNPLRAGIVADLESLENYPFSGHSVLMGKQKAAWQDAGAILKMFSPYQNIARRKYREYVKQGIASGRRPELVGGGLIRSVGGWKIARQSLQGQERIKGDERILGSGSFVEEVLKECNEGFERGYRLRAKGVGVEQLAHRIADEFDIDPAQLFSAVRYPGIVQARSVLCYWAVRELGMTATELARRMGLTQPAVSISVKRGEKIIKEKGLCIERLI